MFLCDRCGSCCRMIGKSTFGIGMALPDGSCKYLDKNTNLCSIYDKRPIYCNVDEYYDLFLTNIMPREKYYEVNKEVCKTLRSARLML